MYKTFRLPTSDQPDKVWYFTENKALSVRQALRRNKVHYVEGEATARPDGRRATDLLVHFDNWFSPWLSDYRIVTAQRRAIHFALGDQNAFAFAA